MTSNLCDEAVFARELLHQLCSDKFKHVGAVTGPGRSGAVAAVYASHILGVPFIPYGNRCPKSLTSY